MVEIPTCRRQPPPLICGRMIRLVAEVLTNCRNAELRSELEVLQDNLAPAAREMDKWILNYRSYGTKPQHDMAGLAEVHGELMEGDREIAAYLIRTVQSYVNWCDRELGKCVPATPSTARSLQTGFLREDLRKLSKVLGELKGIRSANLKNKKRMEAQQGTKRKHSEPTSTDSQDQVKRARKADHSMMETVERDPKNGSLSGTSRNDLSEQHNNTQIQNPRRRKHSKKERILPTNPELASHVAESVLRAIGRHPDMPSLNAGLEDVLPKRPRKAEIPTGMTVATMQDDLVRKAQDWWDARS